MGVGTACIARRGHCRLRLGARYLIVAQKVQGRSCTPLAAVRGVVRRRRRKTPLRTHNRRSVRGRRLRSAAAVKPSLSSGKPSFLAVYFLSRRALLHGRGGAQREERLFVTLFAFNDRLHMAALTDAARPRLAMTRRLRVRALSPGTPKMQVSRSAMARRAAARRRASSAWPCG